MQVDVHIDDTLEIMLKLSEMNNFEPEKDYEFMIDMFNKRNRTENKKTVAIILTSTKPFLQEELAHKVKNR